MAKKRTTKKTRTAAGDTGGTGRTRKDLTPKTQRAGKPSSLLDTRVIYCGECLELARVLKKTDVRASP